MNSNLTTVPATYPTSIPVDSTVLFSSLGFFWQKMFKDIDAVQGITEAQADSVIQGYYKLVELINSYSCYNIPIFERRRWYPLYIYKSQLNHELYFGEGVLFGAEVDGNPYVFGRPIPEVSVTISIIVPEELMQVSLIVNQIISPTVSLVNGTDFTFDGIRITFNSNPFNNSNILTQNVNNADGSPSLYYDYNTSSWVQDKLMVLWCYNAELDSNNLENGLGYLFGLNVPHSTTGKNILTTVLQNYTSGCTVDDIKAVALSTLGLDPYTQVPGTLGLDRYTQVPGTVDLFDNVNSPNWWQTKLTLCNSAPLPLQLPPTLFLGGADYCVSFANTAEPVTLNPSTGAITFPAQGSPKNVTNFLSAISTPAFLSSLEIYTGHALDSAHSYTATINPVDFIFRSFLRTSTAMLRVKFTSTDDLANFINYFNAIRPTLPPQILLLIVCDLSLPTEVLELNTVINDANSLQIALPYQATNDVINLNGSSGLAINDMSSTRNLFNFSSILSGDIRNISLTNAS